MTRPALQTLLTLALITAQAFSQQATRTSDLFTIGGSPATNAVVLAPWAHPPTNAPPESPMLQEIAGIAAVLSPRDIRVLTRAVATETRVAPETRVDEPLWNIHLLGRTGTATVRVGWTPHAWLLAESTVQRARLETDAFNRTASGWITPRPAPPTPPDPTDTDAISPRPAVTSVPTPRASPIRLDSAALSERFAKGRQHPFTPPLTRTISEESFTLRLPADHDTRRPAGLLVWINPTPTADPPPQILLAADALALVVIIPENAGNDRPVVDRLQLALDAAHTAISTVWIDRDRVYIAGMSGGGRLASMLWAGAPDVFTGAIGVVGLNSHHQIPTGDKAGTVWPASHQLPRGQLAASLRQHPIAAISGPRDFNFVEARARIRGLSREGFTARLFDLPDIGHTMPTAEQFLAAARWIERPITESRAQAAEAAQRLLDQIDPDKLSDPDAKLTTREKRALERVTIIAPWTDPAWTAAERLAQ